MLAIGHPCYQDRVAADVYHLLNRVHQFAIFLEFCVKPTKQTFKHQDVPKGIVSLGFDFQAQIIAEILKVVFGDDTVLVQVPAQNVIFRD